jgi:hypothetical protein
MPAVSVRPLLATLVVVPALIAAGCGDDEETTPRKSSELVAIEGALLAKLADQTDEGEPMPEAVSCPANADVEPPAEFDCEVTGSGETGELEVTLRPDGYDYTGMFGPSAFGGTGDGSLAAEPGSPAGSSGVDY